MRPMTLLLIVLLFIGVIALVGGWSMAAVPLVAIPIVVAMGVVLAVTAGLLILERTIVTDTEDLFLRVLTPRDGPLIGILNEIGVPAEVVPLKTREDASRKDLLPALDRASVVFFSGETTFDPASRYAMRSLGELLEMNVSGVTLRGIDLNSFDDFIHQARDPEGDLLEAVRSVVGAEAVLVSRITQALPPDR